MGSMTERKTEAEKENEMKLKQQKEAQSELDEMLNQTRPKNLRQGLKSGLGNILAGAVGAAGVAVAVPVAGMSEGAKKGGIVGGTIGLAGGLVAGAVGAVTVATVGAVSGVAQIGRGVAATPAAITQPRKGKWWDENEGKWVETNLATEAENLKNIPEDDDDILGKARKNDSFEKPDNETTGDNGVFEMYYYDVLGVEPTAEASRLKRQYYVLARKYHPDKVGKDDLESAEKFKDIAEAYQVLSDPRLREVYDKQGREGLSPDKTSVINPVPKLDPEILFAFLFGSDKFNEYIGTLVMATSAAVEDSSDITRDEAKLIQKRRCTRLAIFLAKNLKPWTDGDHDLAEASWKSQADELVKASYGHQLLKTIGQIYSLAATQFIGSLDSGIGMPSISKWAKTQSAQLKKNRNKQKKQIKVLKAGMDIATAQLKIQEEIKNAKTEEEREKILRNYEEELAELTLNMVWTTTVVDITTTLHETCQMVLFDSSVDKHTRKDRGIGLKKLGDIFASVEPTTVEAKNAKDLYEEAALAAMLETVARKENSAFNSSFAEPSK